MEVTVLGVFPGIQPEICSEKSGQNDCYLLSDLMKKNGGKPADGVH